MWIYELLGDQLFFLIVFLWALFISKQQYDLGKKLDQIHSRINQLVENYEKRDDEMPTRLL